LVRIDRTKGSKKAVSTSFELYRMKEKDIPVDVFECNSKDDILQIYWDPYGKRFATLVAEGSKSLVQIYKVDEANIKASSISLIKEIDARGITSLHWSPKGRYLVGAALSGSGTLNFWDTDDVTSLGSGEHYSCTDLEWDPTGRYIITSVSGWKIPNDTGFQLWSLSGEKIMTKSIPGFKQLNWRPRPPTLLSEEQVANIQNSLGDYSKEFNEQDQLLLSMANKEVYEKRMAQLKEYKSFMSRFDQLIADNHDKIVAIFGFNPYENQ
jgi:translation initiation factor 3 subunit B